MTGTVTEILDCGHSYIVQAPNGRVYRRNRAHWSPYNGSSCQDHLGEKRGETAQKQFLSRPSAHQGEICAFPEGHQLYGHQIHVVWATWPISNTSSITHIITPVALFTQVTIIFTPYIISIQGIISWAQLRGFFTWKQEETPVWTSFN